MSELTKVFHISYFCAILLHKFSRYIPSEISQFRSRVLIRKKSEKLAIRRSYSSTDLQKHITFSDRRIAHVVNHWSKLRQTILLFHPDILQQALRLYFRTPVSTESHSISVRSIFCIQTMYQSLPRSSSSIWKYPWKHQHRVATTTLTPSAVQKRPTVHRRFSWDTSDGNGNGRFPNRDRDHGKSAMRKLNPLRIPVFQRPPRSSVT